MRNSCQVHLCFLVGLKNHSKCKIKTNKWESSCSKEPLCSTACDTLHLLPAFEPYLSALPPLPAWLGQKMIKTAKPSHSPIHRVFSVNQGGIHLLLQPPWGWWAERRGAPQFPRSLVGFGAKLCSLACHSLETSLDAGDWAAGVARFTLQEIEASVLLQDGLWGAAGVTSHIFFCRGTTWLLAVTCTEQRMNILNSHFCMKVEIKKA